MQRDSYCHIDTKVSDSIKKPMELEIRTLPPPMEGAGSGAETEKIELCIIIEFSFEKGVRQHYIVMVPGTWNQPVKTRLSAILAWFFPQYFLPNLMIFLFEVLQIWQKY